MNTTVQEAIRNSREHLAEYWAKTLAQRLPGGAGSCVLGVANTAALEDLLEKMEWVEYNHPSIKVPARGFKASLPEGIEGVLGVVRLSELPEDARIVLDDRKNTGKVSAVVKGLPAQDMPKVDFLVAIIGPHPENPNVDVVWTFHPGDPIRPSEVPAEGLAGTTVTVKEAVDLGLEWAKIA